MALYSSRQNNMYWFPISLLEIPLPNEQARMDVLKIHASPIAKHGDIGTY